MFVTTQISYTSSYEVTSLHGYFYAGQIALACGGGPSQSEKQIAASQQQFYNTLTSNYQTAFAGQQNILNTLQSAFTPILAAGPSQYGFSAKEDAALRTQASSGTANAYRMAAQATGQQMSARGGGNQFLPTGADAQLQQQNAQRAAEQESNQQLGITEAGFQTGRMQFGQAASVLGGVGQMYDPSGIAGQANSAGKDAFGSASQITQEEQAASPWNVVGGILGGALNAGISGFTGGLGKGLGSGGKGGGGGGGFSLGSGDVAGLGGYAGP